MKAVVDQGLCIGCGLCTGMEPDVFQMNDDGKAEAVNEADDSNKDMVQDAIDACPVNAISWEN